MEKYIEKNKALIGHLSGELRLLDGKLKRIDIYHTTELTIDLYIELFHGKENKGLKLTFKGIKEYSFYGYLHNFTDIERYKFFESDKGFYLCLDPFSEEEIIAPEDQDFVLSSSVEGYFI
jgi:hypothetical protein